MPQHVSRFRHGSWMAEHGSWKQIGSTSLLRHQNIALKSKEDSVHNTMLRSLQKDTHQEANAQGVCTFP
jgi:hypothetical protein